MMMIYTASFSTDARRRKRKHFSARGACHAASRFTVIIDNTQQHYGARTPKPCHIIAERLSRYAAEFLKMIHDASYARYAGGALVT